MSPGEAPLVELIPRLSPIIKGSVTRPPLHLAPLVDQLELAISERAQGQKFFWFSVPPRHHKSETLKHAIVKHLLRWPDQGVAYCTHTGDFASTQNRSIRRIAASAGLEFSSDSNRQDEWELVTGGGVCARGLGGELTGRGFRLIVVDDPVKSREQAESSGERSKIWDWINDDVVTRLSPDGFVFLVHCIAQGEPILMWDGTWQPVETVAPGQLVAAFEDGSFTARKVVAQRRSGIDDVFKISTSKKSIRANAAHPFLTKSGWLKLSELRVGQEIATVTAAFGAEDGDPDFAWLFGFLVGDGWVTTWARNNKKPNGTISHSRSWCVCFAAGIYPELNERARSLIERFFGRSPKLGKHGYYRLESNEAGRRLIALGLSGGAHGKRIPQWIFKLRPDLKIAFLRGYSDADGHELRASTDSSRISSVSHSLIEDTRRLAISAGLRCGRICKFTQNVRAPHSKVPTHYVCFSVVINHSRAPDAFEKIIEIVPDGNGPVYDLTVEGSENFVASGFVVHNTRWHPDDPIGRAKLDKNWTGVNLPALSGEADDIALLPDVWSVEFLRNIRDTNPYKFASLYQGEPRPRGGKVFGEPTWYDPRELPASGYQIGHGCDLAYATKTYSDQSVLITGIRKNGLIYVVDAIAKRCQAHEFAALIAQKQKERPGPCRWYCSTTERGTAHLMGAHGARIVDKLATADKFVRSQPAANAWNLGKILLPSSYADDSGELIPSPDWVHELAEETGNFTGVNDRHDDHVDALAAMFDQLDSAQPDAPSAPKPYIGPSYENSSCLEDFSEEGI